MLASLQVHAAALQRGSDQNIGCTCTCVHILCMIVEVIQSLQSCSLALALFAERGVPQANTEL